MKYLLYLTLASYLLWSCTEDFPVDANEIPPKLSIFGYITTDTTVHTIEISRSSPYFGKHDPSLRIVRGAKVKINDTILTESDENPGIFHTSSSFYAIPGKSYRLEVDVDFEENGNRQIYTAVATVPQITLLKNVIFGNGSIFAETPFNDRPPMLPIITYTPLQENYYGTDCFYVNDEGKKKYSTLSRYILLKENLINKNVLRPYTIKNTIIFDNTSKVNSKPLDTVIITLNNMSKEIFDFYDKVKIAIRPSIPIFGGQVANVGGNISNGALGCFGAYAVSKIKTPTPFSLSTFGGTWEILVPDEQGKTKTVNVLISGTSGSAGGVTYIKNIRIPHPQKNTIFTVEILQADGSYKEVELIMDNYDVVKTTDTKQPVWKYISV